MKVALIGIGKIAADQHVPAINASPDWELAATVSRSGTVEGVEAWTDVHEMLAKRRDIRVVSLALPPGPRFEYAKAALNAGRHVMLEKPPGATLMECRQLEALALKNRVSLFASWHSREAEMVETARQWLKGKTVRKARIAWKEDVRKWHPGQDWVFEPGGMGVFDPGINALSILTHILPQPVHVRSARVEVPENRQTPIAAQIEFTGNVSAEFDWRQEGPQIWDIEVNTDHGDLVLTDGGASMTIDGAPQSQPAGALSGEYPRLYAHMARLVDAGKIDMDMAPLIHVADAMMIARRDTVSPFEW